MVTGRTVWKKLGSKRTAMIAGVVCVAVAVLLWRGLARRDVPTAFIVEMKVVDDSAVLVWRANYTDRDSQGWVSRVSSAGHTLWWRALPAPASLGGVEALQVGEGIVAVRYSHSKKDHALVAFSLEDGRQLWNRTLASYEPETIDGGGTTEPWLELDASGRFVGGQLVEWVNRGVPGRKLIVVNPRTGDLKPETDAPTTNGMVLTIGSRLLQHRLFDVVSFNVADGRATSITTVGIGCIVDNDYITIERDGQGTMSLVAFHEGDLTARRVIKASFDPTPDSREPMTLRRCGTYRDRMVFVLDASFTVETGARLVVITNRSGDVLHTIELPADDDWDGEGIAARHYDKTSLAGQLTRYVPYVSIGRDDERHNCLYMLDLEAGKIEWRGAYDESLLNAHLFRGTDHWYLVSGFYRDIVSVFDGSTGKFITATMTHNYNGVSNILPEHVGAGKLWIASQQWQPINRAPIATLDADTLAPAFNHTVELHDMTAKVRQELLPRD